MLNICFCTDILDWTVPGLRNFDTTLILSLFCFYITYVITLSPSFGGYWVEKQCRLIDWFLCNLDALIEVYNYYFTYVLLILFINLYDL